GNLRIHDGVNVDIAADRFGADLRSVALADHPVTLAILDPFSCGFNLATQALAVERCAFGRHTKVDLHFAGDRVKAVVRGVVERSIDHDIARNSCEPTALNG